MFDQASGRATLEERPPDMKTGSKELKPYLHEELSELRFHKDRRGWLDRGITTLISMATTCSHVNDGSTMLSFLSNCFGTASSEH